jgi:hypothetical protein
MVAWSQGGRLHVAAVDLHRQAASIVEIDAEGRTGAALPLPVEYPIGLTGSGPNLWLTGAAGESRPVLMELAADRTTVAVRPIPVAGVLSYGPRPLSLQDGAVVVWETTGDDSARLFVSGAHVAGLDPPVDRRMDRLTTALDVGSLGEDVFVARVSGSDARLEVLRLDSRLTDRGSVRLAGGATAAALTVARSNVAVAWLSGGELALQWLDHSLRASDDSSVLVSLNGRAVLRSLRAIGGEEGWLALLYQVLHLGDARVAGSGAELGRAERQVDDFLCLVAPGSSGVMMQERLPPGYWGGASGGWLGPRFVLVRGGRQGAISVFEARTVR